MWRPRDLGPQRKRLTVAVAVVNAVLVMGLLAPPMHDQASLEASVEIVDATSLDNDSAIEQLTVRVTNEDSHPIEPVLWKTSTSRKAFYAWRIVDGPERLQPHQPAEIVIRTDDVYGAFPTGEIVILTISDGQLRDDTLIRFANSSKNSSKIAR